MAVAHSLVMQTQDTGGQSKIAFCPQGHLLSWTGSGWALCITWAK